MENYVKFPKGFGKENQHNGKTTQHNVSLHITALMRNPHKGCAGCGDDFGTLVCRHCGATMPGVCLSDLPKKTDSEKPESGKEAV